VAMELGRRVARGGRKAMSQLCFFAAREDL
jgi:hypothetical protein